MDLQKLIKQTEEKNPGQPLYNQAVREVLETICDFVNEHPKYDQYKIVERLLEPERIVKFKVTWVDDIQGRFAFPPDRDGRHHEVPCFRADLQKLPDHSAYGRR